VGFSAAVAVAQRLLKNSRTVSQKSIYGTPAGGWVGFSAAVAVAQRLLKNSRTVSQKSIYGTPAGGWVGFSAAVAVAQRLLKNSRTVSQKSIYGTPAGGGVGFSAAVAVAQRLLTPSGPTIIGQICPYLAVYRTLCHNKMLVTLRVISQVRVLLFSILLYQLIDLILESNWL